MQLEQDARVWQTIGIIAWAAGSGMLLMLFRQNGVVRIRDLNTLSGGLAASFLMLAGIAGTVFGRVMAAVLHGYQDREARLWRLFALVCTSCGTLAVLYAAVQTWSETVSLTHMTIGLAGAFLIMAGVICLLGNRVMHHATQRFADGGVQNQVKAAGA